ncbi:MAG: Glutamate--tRNA ligase [Verrucomicrobiales bacterium]|nr:Glutamate--tRNA ligase [Verrucomicrobiales bacterium]
MVAAHDFDCQEDRLIMSLETPSYRGRIAPSPTGYLHLGHARTFWVAQQRVIEYGGILVLRNEDLDSARCKPEFVSAMIEDLHWFGFRWQEGPDCGGTFGPYTQSQRLELYRSRFELLRESGFIYPCTCSRQDVLRSVSAPHAADDEPIYPGTCRGKSLRDVPVGTKVSWRFRVPDGETISFLDGSRGVQSFWAGKDFGDFIVWRHDGIPSYQLAVVTDDDAMQITEVVRGMDLLLSTARQLLLYRALNVRSPKFFHCPLLHDESGKRLAKRHDALSLRALRIQGQTPESIRCSALFSG